ncbi:hypothetical protein [Clavibacter capsici]|uniref:Uncharacterized protein n=1 Tax=Clavibacter capsici TaxID=1874630 RepID=A0A0M5JZW4_9MICO|nr:hypothetical protein [Clavibacter capsici]ALD13484.1 hypothetical protein AES38_11660 [Clavibacter capsici]QIS39831.1 hypothetical protein GW572_12095 [Clavibacter capsici]QIS42747.1 hypothetical protein GW571_11675 [Clavibacter capsici]QIS45690.1 hypothetical protein GW570_11645 [Clavibacter capsici]
MSVPDREEHPRMRIPSPLSRLGIGACAAAGLALSALAVGPAPAALAQSNVRVCAAWNSAQTPGSIGTGLLVKVYKDGSYTCDQKLEYMYDHYGEAYRGSSVQHTVRLISCEDFAVRIGSSGDPCYGLTENAIYRFTSSQDLLHPVRHPEYAYWRA